MNIAPSLESCPIAWKKLSYIQNVEKRYSGDMMTFDAYIKNLLSCGKVYFTAQDAIAELGISSTAFLSRVYRMKQKGELISPAKNLYVIVSPEYRDFGCIPAPDLTIILMRYWDVEYYAGLLSAALYHGASHQKPSIFQVIVNKQIRPIHIGRISIEFIYKKSFKYIQRESVSLKSGYLKISSPEVTAMDLLLYPSHVGGINAIATILSELVESLEAEKLVSLASKFNAKVWVQRLAWILDKIDSINNEKKALILEALREYLSGFRLYYAPASPELPTTGAKRNKKWMIIENTTVESDYDS